MRAGRHPGNTFPIVHQISSMPRLHCCLRNKITQGVDTAGNRKMKLLLGTQCGRRCFKSSGKNNKHLYPTNQEAAAPQKGMAPSAGVLRSFYVGLLWTRPRQTSGLKGLKATIQLPGFNSRPSHFLVIYITRNYLPNFCLCFLI